MSKPNVRIPQPDRVRRINGSFAWIDHRLLRNGFQPVMTPQEQSLYLFLALAADQHGVSFYRKEKICLLLGMDFAELEIARDRLIDLRLIAFAPYSALSVNGFYQVLPIEHQAPDFARMNPAAARAPATTPPPTTATPDRARTDKPPAASAADLAAGLAQTFRCL